MHDRAPTSYLRRALPLAAIVAVGAFVRFFRLDAGLPEVVHVDSFKFVDEAARMAVSGDLRPQGFQYPGLFTYVLALFYRLGNVEGVYWKYLLAQAAAAASGVALIPATFLAARRICGRPAALLAAGLASVCILGLTMSRIPSPDNLGAVFMTLALWAMLAPRLTWRQYVLAGIFGGLAVGSKFNGLYVLPYIALVSLLGPGRAGWKQSAPRVVAALAIAVVVFTLTTPFFWSESGEFLDRMELEARIQRSGQVGRIQGGALDYLVSSTPTWEQPWLSTSFLHNLGLPGSVALVLAVAAALAGRGGRGVFLYGLYIAVYLVLISGPGHLKAYRFLMPVLPVAYALIAWGAERALRRFVPRRRGMAVATMGVVAVALLAQPFYATGRHVACTTRPLTNQLATAWMLENIPGGSRVMLSPLFVENLVSLDFEFFSIGHAGPRQYRLPEGVGASGERDPIYHPEMLAELSKSGVRFLVLNSYFDGAFAPIPENKRYFPRSVRAFREFMERLEREGSLVFSVDGHSAGRLGPDITIYEIQ